MIAQLWSMTHLYWTKQCKHVEIILTISCKGQRFIVTLQKDQGNKKQNENNRNGREKKIILIHHPYVLKLYTDHSLILHIFNITILS